MSPSGVEVGVGSLTVSASSGRQSAFWSIQLLAKQSVSMSLTSAFTTVRLMTAQHFHSNKWKQTEVDK
jgi:hypothetical protein